MIKTSQSLRSFPNQLLSIREFGININIIPNNLLLIIQNPLLIRTIQHTICSMSHSLLHTLFNNFIILLPIIILQHLCPHTLWLAKHLRLYLRLNWFKSALHSRPAEVADALVATKGFAVSVLV